MISIYISFHFESLVQFRFCVFVRLKILIFGKKLVFEIGFLF